MSVAGDAVDQLARTVLYEGYALYPYRPSALKNQRRFAFGAIYPRAWAERTLDAALLRAEVVVLGRDARVFATVRFLRLDRGGGAREISIELPALGGATVRWDDDGIALDLETAIVRDGEVARVAIEIRNVSRIDDVRDHEAVMDVVPASTHVALRVEGGAFVSAIDPPAHAAAATAACRSSGLYPVLVGDSAMLCAPIILPDYPQLAAQSPGDFFDGTEIDEMLTLRVLTMTDDEKREACANDPKIAALIARTEALGIEATASLHGVVRTPWPREGTRVRVQPARASGADAFDILLAGKLATVAGVERDLEGRVLCAVTIDDDPGADLGALGMPGHRFYFRPDELEVIA